MDPLVIIAVVAALALVGVLLAWERQRAIRLQRQYGNEYQRAVDDLGRLRGERELELRESRVKTFNVRSLTREQRDRFARRWEALQAQFIDEPEGAVNEGERLVEDVLDARGYPAADLDDRLEHLSVHHATVVDDYRSLHEVAVRQRGGEASTEDLRQAMVHLRSVFEELLEDREPAGERVVEREVVREDIRRIHRVRPAGDKDREMPA